MTSTEPWLIVKDQKVDHKGHSTERIVTVLPARLQDTYDDKPPPGMRKIKRTKKVVPMKKNRKNKKEPDDIEVEHTVDVEKVKFDLDWNWMIVHDEKVNHIGHSFERIVTVLPDRFEMAPLAPIKIINSPDSSSTSSDEDDIKRDCTNMPSLILYGAEGLSEKDACWTEDVKPEIDCYGKVKQQPDQLKSTAMTTPKREKS